MFFSRLWKFDFFCIPWQNLLVMNKIFALLVFLLTLGSSGLAQEGIIKGIVTEAGTQAALAGVEVRVEGKQQATLTDQQGAFSIKAAEKDILVFKFLGYETKKVKVGKKNNIKVILQAEQTLL